MKVTIEPHWNWHVGLDKRGRHGRGRKTPCGPKSSIDTPDARGPVGRRHNRCYSACLRGFMSDENEVPSAETADVAYYGSPRWLRKRKYLKAYLCGVALMRSIDGRRDWRATVREFPAVRP